MIDYEVRDGKQVAPTCPECGCRLFKDETNSWFHFTDIDNVDKDSRGHICSLVNDWWELPHKNKYLTV